MESLINKSEILRKKIIKTAWEGQAGHITSSLSMVDILATLYWGGILRHDPANSQWENRDQFILSKAHGGLGYYVLLALDGYFNVEDLRRYCQPGQHLGDHSNFCVNGVENSGGSLGHGLGIAAGKALSAKLNDSDNLIYVLTGDGECQEGSIWESAMMIGNFKLNNLIWIIDYNEFQANSRTNDTMSLEPLQSKLDAFGFEVKKVNGHDHQELKKVLEVDRNNLPQRPTAVIAYTIKGYGIPLFEGKEGWHGRTPNAEEYTRIIEELGLTMEEFEKI